MYVQSETRGVSGEKRTEGKSMMSKLKYFVIIIGGELSVIEMLKITSRKSVIAVF